MKTLHDSDQTSDTVRRQQEVEQSPALDDSAQVALEEASCPNCDGATDDDPLHEFGRFQVCRCARCGLVRLSPRLAETELAQFYDGEYFAGARRAGYDDYERDRPLYEKTFARRLRLIRRFKPAGALLDIGCGPGYFLAVARRAGYDVRGLDCSAYAVERARAEFPERVAQGFLTRSLYAEKSFDVVTMFDLFEHVYHPRGFLSDLHAATKDDGVVVITTPNQRSLLARASGRNWVSYKIPEHVFYYTPETLRRMASPLFEVALVRSEGQYCTLEFLAERAKTLSRPFGGALARAVSLIGASRLPVYVNSGSMTVVLRKRV